MDSNGVDIVDSKVDVASLMVRAFGAPLVHSSGKDATDAWYQRWKKVVYLQGRHYDLPEGAIGRQYVDMLNEEVSQVAAGNYSTDHLIVFSSFMLQRDRMIRKGVDIRRVLERRMKMWKIEDFDPLLQEVIRCDKHLKNTRRSDTDEKHIVKVFTRLMM